MSKENENIKQELVELGCSVLVEIHGRNSFFHLPDGYFAHREAVVLDKGILFPHSKDETFQIPEMYFEELDLDAVVADDDVAIDDKLNLLDSIGKIKSPFKVQQNYFENLHLDILTEEADVIKEKSEAKLVSIFRNLNKYVAAAVILVIVSVGSNFFLRMKEMKNAYNSLQEMNIHHELADIPTDEIVNYLSSHKKIEHFSAPNTYNNPLNIISNNSTTKEQGKNADIEIIQSLNEEDPIF